MEEKRWERKDSYSLHSEFQSLFYNLSCRIDFFFFFDFIIEPDRPLIS